MSDTAGGCPRGNEYCGYARGDRYCSLWDTCQDLAELSRQLEAIREAERQAWLTSRDVWIRGAEVDE